MSGEVESALLHLERAAAGDDADTARQALERFGRGALEGDPAAAVERFAPAVAGLDPLIARGVVALGTQAGLYPDEAVPGILYGRSGYQFLLDAGTWAEAPLSDFHLGDVDEAIADAVERHGIGLPAPPPVPAGHVWWRQS